MEDRIIIERKTAALILSNPKKIAGHFLVIPKRHVEKPWELTSEEQSDIFELILLVQKTLYDNKIAPGSDICEHYRPFIKQGRIKVDHIHYHVLPRNMFDRIYNTIEKHETEEFYEKLDAEEASRFKRLFDHTNN
jgi:diadenosine tetraphosphate (Ap4A) HIT family hydrolase